MYAASIGTTTDDLEWPWMVVSRIARYLCGSWASCITSDAVFKITTLICVYRHRCSCVYRMTYWKPTTPTIKCPRRLSKTSQCWELTVNSCAPTWMSTGWLPPVMLTPRNVSSVVAKFWRTYNITYPGDKYENAKTINLHAAYILAHDAFVRTNRRAIATMFVRLSVCLSVSDGRAL